MRSSTGHTDIQTDRQMEGQSDRYDEVSKVTPKTYVTLDLQKCDFTKFLLAGVKFTKSWESILYPLGNKQ